MKKKDDKKYEYNRFGSKGARVGQAVHDILSINQTDTTVEEILDQYQHRYTQDLERAIEEGVIKFKVKRLYILSLMNKEHWATNVVRNWFVTRKTPPYATDMITQYPHHCKTLYMADAEKGDLKLLWSIPGIEDCKSILKNPAPYDIQLIQWIKEAFEGKLNKDSY